VVNVLKRRPRLGGAVYVLPNLLTTGNLFFGFFSIVKSLQGDFVWAASAIVLAAIFDVLDGRVARLTGGTSEFGIQYDSLCDLVSFGLAPAFMVYKFGLSNLGRVGWILCFLYLACGALRLARFNVQSSIGKSSGDFTGLPIPMAGILTAGFVAASSQFQNEQIRDFWLLQQLGAVFANAKFNTIFLAVMTPVLALLMVSNIAYRSHKVLRITGIKPFQLLVLSVVALGFFAYEPELVGLLFGLLYALSGPFEWVVGWKKAIDDDEIFTPLGEDESVMEPRDDPDSWEPEPPEPNREKGKLGSRLQGVGTKFEGKS